MYSVEAAAKEIVVMVRLDHDCGLLVNHQLDTTNEEAVILWRDQVVKHVQERIRTPAAVKPPMCMDEVLAELQNTFPGENWEEEDACFSQPKLLCCKPIVDTCI